ncbi:hypothetical protein Tco_0419941 [Tanacetum coccineum]
MNCGMDTNKKVPNLSYLKVWGCEALVKRDTPDKLEQRYVKYAEFFEKRLICQEISGRAVDLEEIQEEEDTTPSEKQSKFLLPFCLNHVITPEIGINH